jgi:putative membrane protein
MSTGKMLVSSLALSMTMAAAVFAAAPEPQEFVSQAGIAGLYEVRAAEVAREKAQDAKLREFADQMVNDHQKANQELRELAKLKDWTVPAALDPEHQQMVDRLGGLEGAEFDREYARQQLQAHEQAVALFEEQSEAGTDSQLKAWASGKLPTLRNHLGHARQLGDAARDGDAGR